jgi:probable HAF family extracellular repeat protein
MVSRPTAINNAGQVVGINYGSNSVSHSTLWSNGTITDLAVGSEIGDELNRPEDINDLGQVVGSAGTSDGAWNATLWNNGVMTNLGGDHSRAYAINNVGQVVGYNLLPSGEAHATLWENGKMTDLNSLVAASTMGDWALSSASDINEAGWIVGSMTDSVTLENRGFLLTPLTSVPLPAASWLFGSTVGFLTLMKYRKKSSFFKA